MMHALVACGVVGPLLFIAVFAVAGWRRAGYRARDHFVSSLSRGPGGWVQAVNFLQCGALVSCFAVGAGLGAVPIAQGGAVPWLLGAFGLGLLVSGVFATDAVVGEPAQTYASHGMTATTTAGRIHGLAGIVCFVAVVATACVMAVRFAGRGDTGWSVYSGATALVVAGFFVADGALMQKAAHGEISNRPIGLYQRLAIIPGWSWVAIVALHLMHELD